MTSILPASKEEKERKKRLQAITNFIKHRNFFQRVTEMAKKKLKTIVKTV